MTRMLAFALVAVALSHVACAPCPATRGVPAPCATSADCGGANCVLPADGGSGSADGGTKPGYCDVQEKCE